MKSGIWEGLCSKDGTCFDIDRQKCCRHRAFVGCAKLQQTQFKCWSDRTWIVRASGYATTCPCIVCVLRIRTGNPHSWQL